MDCYSQILRKADLFLHIVLSYTKPSKIISERGVVVRTEEMLSRFYSYSSFLFLNDYSFLFTVIHSYLPVFLKPKETSPFTPLLFVKVVCFPLSTCPSTPNFPVYNVTMYSFLQSGNGNRCRLQFV